jgi:predicted Zn-dependent protease
LITAGLPAAPAAQVWPVELRSRLAELRAEAAGLFGGQAALGALSRLYHANGWWREARQCYAILEQLDPREPRWWHRHAWVLASFGESDPALARWERVQLLAPDYIPAQVRLGDLLLKTNSTARAGEIYEGVLRREPNQPHALFGLARLDFEAGRWAQARVRLETGVAKTNYALGYDLIVTVCERLGDHARAAEIRGRVKASGAYRDVPDPWLDELIADCYDASRLALEAGLAAERADFATARRWLERAVALTPGEVAVRFQLASVLAALRDSAGARREFERCTRIAPGFADAWSHWAAALQYAGDIAGAQRVIATGLQHCPESPGLHLMQARQLAAAGRPAEALVAYQAAIRYRPNEADAFLELATTLFRLERVPEGLKWLEAGLAAEPEHPPTLALLAYHAIGSGDEASARTWMQRVRRQPRVPAEQVDRLRQAFHAQFGRVPP